MKKNRNFLSFFTSVGGIGFIPFAPGSFGSFAGLVLSYFIAIYTQSIIFLLISSIFIFLLGWFITYFEVDSLEFQHEKIDPSYIVIDEVAGMMLALALYSFCMNPTLFDTICIFFLFRFFDILKPFPIGWIENKLCSKRKTAALGIMFDDMLAALFTALTYFFLCFFL